MKARSLKNSLSRRSSSSAPSDLWLESHSVPPAPKKAHRIRLHGMSWEDPYHWLRNPKSPEVRRSLSVENAHFTREMRPLRKNVRLLYREMRKRLPPSDSSAPSPWGPYEYRSEFKKGAQYKRFLRREVGSKKDEVILDENAEAKGKNYFALGGLAISDDHRLLAFASDFNGSEKYQIRLRNLETGETLSEKLANGSGSMAWSANGRYLFYVVIDKSLRPYRVYRHERGTSARRDVLIFEEKDPKHFVHLARSSSGQFVFIESHGKITSEIWFLDAYDPLGKFKCLSPRREAHEYSVDHRGDQFYILSNLHHRGFQVLTTPSDRPRSANRWAPLDKKLGVSTASRDVYRISLRTFRDFLVMEERSNGLPQIRIVDFKRKRNHLVRFSDSAYSVGVDSANHQFHTSIVRLTYSSPVQPTQTIAYDMSHRTRRVLKEEIVRGYRRKLYHCKRIFVKSHDGVRVPLTLVWKKGRPRGGPGYLYGYGSYGHSLPDSFAMIRNALSLIDRGFVYAIAHVRGGSEMGRDWYEDGKFLKKMNTFKDFIACGEHLVGTGLVGKHRLGCSGGSAGGMLVGASMNLKPDLFSAVAAHVPFVDVLNTMMDSSLPLTPVEFKEWGNPAEKKFFNIIRKYSPYDNVREGVLPYLLVTAGLNDPRVTYWEPAKWVARLRELRASNKMLLFKINMGAGHFGASGRFHYLVEKAEEYAFMLRALMAR